MLFAVFFLNLLNFAFITIIIESEPRTVTPGRKKTLPAQEATNFVQKETGLYIR